MELIKSNKFEISDMPGTNTIAFLVENEIGANNKFSTLQKIEHVAITKEGRTLKEFSVEATSASQDVVLVTLTKNKAILNTGLLNSDGFTACDHNVPLSYSNIYNQDGIEYKEFAYTPNAKRRFTIIDTETCDEVKPVVYMDPDTKEVKGRCKLLPLRSYVVLELLNAIITKVNEKGEIEYGESTKDNPLKLVSLQDKQIEEPDGLIV